MADYNYKVEIEIDEEKVIADHKYSLEKMYGAIRKMFAGYGVVEIPNGKTLTFIESREDRGFSSTSFPACALLKKEWAKPYLKRVYWYDYSEGDESCEDFIYEAEHSKFKGV